MTADPRFPRSPAERAGETLEDRVYRPTLGEGNPELAGASRWRTVPVTAALLVLFGGLAVLLGRARGDGEVVLPSVGLVLQEGLDQPAGNGGAGPRPPAPAPVARPAPAAEPAPVPAPVPPPEVRPPVLPVATPADLPRAEAVREAGTPGGGGTGPGTGTGPGAGPGAGPGPGRPGAGTAGAGAERPMTVEVTKADILYRPTVPEYPRLARLARIQGVVRVDVQVGTDGIPVLARALDGPYQLRAAAETYAMSWRLKAPSVNGVPRPFRFDLAVTFHLD